MTKTIALLGSTGSIGRQTLQVARELKLRVAALAAGSSVELLEAQAREFSPRLAVLYDKDAAAELRQRLRDTDIEVLAGPEGLLAAAQAEEADTVVTAVVGSVGLEPTLAAIRLGRRIALANKETLVCAGELVMAAARECGADIVPVDSEHSAIFQCLQGCADRREIKRLILTCSGGPFFGKRYEELEHMTPADALKHPNWSMGAKITIDSATLMNKGLEVIEAMRLYDLPLLKVEAVIHRQSVVHSLVEFVDGAVLAQLGVPDMRIPIGLAMTYPNRAHNPAPALDLLTCGPLTFDAIDETAFPCFALAKQAAQLGGTACTALNAANEEAVGLFLQDKIGFYDIADAVEAALRLPVVLMFLWKNLGFCLIIFLAALQSIPQPLYEYAQLEGAGFFTRAFRITLPMITPTAFLVFVLAWINAFKIFKEVYFIAGAYPDYSVYTLQNYMNNMFGKLNYQLVTAAAYSFGLIVFALFGALFFLQRRAARGLN